MKHNMNKEIAALMQQFPFKYPADKYSSVFKQFNIIINELFVMGTIVHIERRRQLNKSQSQAMYTYGYQLEINHEAVKIYKSRESAKKRIFRLYQKARNQKVDGN